MSLKSDTFVLFFNIHAVWRVFEVYQTGELLHFCCMLCGAFSEPAHETDLIEDLFFLFINDLDGGDKEKELKEQHVQFDVLHVMKRLVSQSPVESRFEWVQGHSVEKKGIEN